MVLPPWHQVVPHDVAVVEFAVATPLNETVEIAFAWVDAIRPLDPWPAVPVPEPLWQLPQVMAAFRVMPECEPWEPLMLGKEAPLGQALVALEPWQSQQDDVPEGTPSPFMWHPVQSRLALVNG